MKSITLGSKTVSVLSKPYVIAEIGVNHGGSIDLAKEMISAAKRAGADAAKFQSYKAEKLVIKNSPAYWDLTKEGTKTQHELFKKYDIFNDSEYIELAQFCRDIKIDFASTPFDLDAVQYLDPVVAYFKVASADLCNIPLLEAIAETGKPIILSTGASRLDEIQETVEFINSVGCKDLMLMHCTLSYPTKIEDANLLALTTLQRAFPTIPIGLSDHTLGPLIGASSVLLGACAIEKHFTFDKSLPLSADHWLSVDESEMAMMVSMVRNFELARGLGEKIVLPSEELARKNARRSLVTKERMKKGDQISLDSLVAKRPGTGIPPNKITDLIGKVINQDVDVDTIITWSMLS